MSKKKPKEEEIYYCYECGAVMKKADAKVLVCPECQHSVDIENYATEEEDYEQLFSGHSRYLEPDYWPDNEEFPPVNYDDAGEEE